MSTTTRVGRLQDKIVIVAGASSGIGRATALVAHDEGAKVALLDYDPQGAKAVDGLPIGCDVSNPDEVDRAVGEVIDRFGRVDILINVAGINDKYTPIEELNDRVWTRVFDINVRGTALMTKPVLEEMLTVESGAIVNISSTASLVAGGGGVAYTASKGAVSSMTGEIAFEVGGRGIRVNAVAPGITTTNFRANSSAILDLHELTPGAQRMFDRAAGAAFGNVPLGRGAEPSEIAKAVVFLASDEASYITGSVMVVDGGRTIH
ncbi:SDR family NAD(P)-dependent oxidoreductase [Nocardia sp. NPDC051900]|uniref:SDR family NAD(P)-dependent oxidoreductase n=1 Tax=Nocardia sp. NPDC051900 TaxID=3364326 RepID=UPI00378B3EA3